MSVPTIADINDKGSGHDTHKLSDDHPPQRSPLPFRANVLNPRYDSSSSSGSRGHRKQLRAIKDCLTCKELDIEQYRLLLIAVLIFNLLMFAGEVVRLAYIVADRTRKIGDNIAGVLSFVATVLTLVNCGFLFYLIRHCHSRIAMIAACITLALEVLYIVQTAIYFHSFGDSIGFVALTIMFLLVQLATAWLLYRYWEFSFYNYDETSGLNRTLMEDVQSGNSSSNRRRSGDLEQAINHSHNGMNNNHVNSPQQMH